MLYVSKDVCMDVRCKCWMWMWVWMGERENWEEEGV